MRLGIAKSGNLPDFRLTSSTLNMFRFCVSAEISNGADCRPHLYTEELILNYITNQNGRTAGSQLMKHFNSVKSSASDGNYLEECSI